LSETSVNATILRDAMFY